MGATQRNEEDDLLSVVLTAEDRSRSKAFVHRSTSTMATVRMSWAVAWSVDVDGFLLLHRGRVVADEATLGDLEAAVPGLVELAVEEKVRVLVGLPGAARSARRALLVGLSQTPEDLREDLRQALGPQEGGEWHLWTAVQALRPGQSLRASGVQEGSLLIVSSASSPDRRDQSPQQGCDIDIEALDVEQWELPDTLRAGPAQDDPSMRKEVEQEAESTDVCANIDEDLSDRMARLSHSSQEEHEQRRSPAPSQGNLDDCKKRSPTSPADPSAVTTVRVVLVSPERRNVEGWTVGLDGNDPTWVNVARKLDLIVPYRIDRKYAAAVQVGRLYRHGLEVRRAVQTWDPETHQICFRGELDGCLVDEKTVTHHIREVLLYDYPVRSSRGHLPVLTVFLTTTVVHMTQSDEPELTEAPMTALCNLDYLVLMTGLEMKNRYGDFKTFIQLSDSSFCDVATGDHFPDNESVLRHVHKTSNERGMWHHLFVLLGNGDWLPQWRIPDSEVAYLFMRHNVGLEVEENRLLWSAGQMLSLHGEWTQPRSVGDLQTRLSSVMRS